MFESVRALTLHSALAGVVEAEVFALEDEYSAADGGLWLPLRPSVTPVRGPERYGISWRLGGAVEKARLDLLHLHGIWMYPSLVALRWSRNGRRPVVVSPHGMLDSWALRTSPVKKTIVGSAVDFRLLRKAAAIRSLCREETEAIGALELERPVCEIPNGVDLPPEEACTIDTLGPGEASAEGKRTLLFLGRIHPKKNLIGLLDAWSRFQSSAEGRMWRLRIVGWDQGGHEGELRRRAVRLGLRDVDFSGPMYGQEKKEALREATAFILPSFSEGLPMAVLEAAAWARPSLITSHCNLPGLVVAGGAFQIGVTAEEIYAGLSQMGRASGGALRQMGWKARRHVEETFTWSRIGAEMRAVYLWLIGEGERPKCVSGEAGK